MENPELGVLELLTGFGSLLMGHIERRISRRINRRINRRMRIRDPERSHKISDPIQQHDRTTLAHFSSTSHQQALLPHSVIPTALRHEQDHGYPVYPHLQHRHACSDRR